MVSRNDGLSLASGEFVVFLDADDELLEGALSALRSGFRPDDVAVLGKFAAVDGAGDPLDIGTWANEQLRPVVRRRGHMVTSSHGLTAEAMMTRLVTPPPGAIMFRRDALERVHGFDPRLERSEDVDLLVRVGELGALVALPVVVLKYRRSATQRSAATKQRRWGRQITLLHLVTHAPTRRDAWVRARGAAAHHLDRATTRWRFGERRTSDLLSAVRSVLLSLLFRLAGMVAMILGPKRASRLL